MIFAVYRKSDLQLLGYSGTATSTVPGYEYTFEMCVNDNVIPNYGGTIEDYDYVELTIEQEIARATRHCWVEIDAETREPKFVLGDPIEIEIPEPPKTPEQLKIEELETQLRNVTAIVNTMLLPAE